MTLNAVVCLLLKLLNASITNCMHTYRACGQAGELLALGADLLVAAFEAVSTMRGPVPVAIHIKNILLLLLHEPNTLVLKLLCIASLFTVPNSSVLHPSSQSQTLPNIPPHDLLILGPPLPPHARRIHIRWTLIIRLRKHTHHTNQNLLHALDRGPALARLFVLVRIIAGRMEDGYADFAVGIDYA
jgi:hypothetical protein